MMYPLVNRFAKKRGKKLPIILGCMVFSAAEIVICFSNMLYKPTSLDSAGYRYIKKTVDAAFPYAAAVPFILPAGTDARRFTDLSDAVIRFAPIDIDKQQYASVHGENENISVEKLHLAVDFYKSLLRNYPQI